MAVNDFVIICDVTADLPASYLSKHNIDSVPLTYTIDDVDYSITIGNDMQPPLFYEKLRQGFSAKTTQNPPESALRQFKRHLDDGKDVLYICFSSGLSGTYSSACIAQEEISPLYSNNKVLVIDSLCASLGQGLLVDFARKLKDEGKTIDEVFALTMAQALHVCHYFTVDDLNHLYRGGRVSKISALVGTLLGIKPVMHVNNDGKLIPYGKVRGRKASLDALVTRMGQKLDSIPNDYVFISHGDCLADAQYVASQIELKHGLKTEIINFVGTVIGSHSGPGTIAIFFMGTNRDEEAM